MSSRNPLRVIADQIPVFLRIYALYWCVWGKPSGDGTSSEKPSKRPLSPSSGLPISVSNREGWTDSDTALRALNANQGYAGVGLLLTDKSGLVGIDLDHANSEDGVMKPWANEIVAAIHSYWERSPSGQGLRCFVQGRLTGDAPKRITLEDGSIEIYDRGRYLTVTGHHLDGAPDQVEEHQQGIDWLVTRMRERSRAATPIPGESEPAAIFPILQGCAWMRRCREQAASLSEADWYRFLGVVGRCQDGTALAHEWSRPYPTYSPEETERKLQQALTQAGPVTCEYVAGSLGHAGLCNSCPNRGRVRSPILLGRPRREAALDDPWPTPEPVTGSFPPVLPFPLDALPELLRRFAIDVSERMQVPIDFVAATLMVVWGAVVGRRAKMFPKRHDDWVVIPNLWGGILGLPAALKTPSIKAVLRILNQLEQEAALRNVEAMTQYQRDLEVHKALQKAWAKNAADAARDGVQIQPFDNPEPMKPQQLRFVLNDPTIAKLHEVHADNPQGILLFRDELAGWFAVLDSQGHEADRSFYLEAWDGDTPYSVDRIDRGTIRVPHLCISVFGGIQPDVMQRYLIAAIIGSGQNDGLAQRLQVMVYPDPPTTWQNVDRRPDDAARNGVEELFRRIIEVSPEEPLIRRFDDDAQEVFNEWRRTLELRLLHEEMEPYLKSHLGKYRSLMPTLACLCHMVDDSVSTDIPMHQAQRAILWCEYLESHARRVYAVGSGKSVAALLAEKVTAGALGTRFSVRDVVKKNWHSLNSPELVRTAIRELVESGWLRKEPARSTDRGGRPADAYLVNPHVYGG